MDLDSQMDVENNNIASYNRCLREWRKQAKRFSFRLKKYEKKSCAYCSNENSLKKQDGDKTSTKQIDTTKESIRKNKLFSKETKSKSRRNGLIRSLSLREKRRPKREFTRTYSFREKIAKNADAVFRKLTSSNSTDENDNLDQSWSKENGSFIRTHRKNSLKNSHSCDSVNYNGEFTTKPDLLRRFGQKSIHLSQDKAAAKVLMQVFADTKKGPDVKPPRNERRTLKLSKIEEEGFGFWLQTYAFGKDDNLQKRTFVRYVEDEGPAYMAGLREGDVIVEVNGITVEEEEHMKIVDKITEAKKQIVLVVKFMDAVRRVELAVRLKKKEAKLKAKKEELLKLIKEEQALQSGASIELLADKLTTDLNLNTARDGDNDSLSTSTESELSSMSSISSDEVTVRTSKFEKRSSRVLDSIKELHCIDTSSQSSRRSLNIANVTTENELLDIYADKADEQYTLNRRAFRSGLMRHESMPTQKYATLPRYKAVIDLDGKQAREYAIENSTTGHLSDSFQTSRSKDFSSDEDESIDSQSPVISRKNRQSYKLAMKVKLKEGSAEVDV